jgi:hypothetical protein
MQAAWPRNAAQKGLLAFYAGCAVVGWSDAARETAGGWAQWLAARALAVTLFAHLAEFAVVFLVLRWRILKRLPATDSIWPHFLPTFLYGVGHWMRLTKAKKKA